MKLARWTLSWHHLEPTLGNSRHLGESLLEKPGIMPTPKEKEAYAEQFLSPGHVECRQSLVQEETNIWYEWACMLAWPGQSLVDVLRFELFDLPEASDGRATGTALLSGIVRIP